MDSKLLLDVKEDQIAIALMEDERLVEFNRESRVASFAVGNIYLAKVRKIMPGLNAAFVEVGYEKEGFMHYMDLGNGFSTMGEALKRILADKRKAYTMNKVQVMPDLPKEGAISDYIAQGQEILVQVAKEPISTKGPRLTAEISLAGRNLVLIPFGTKVSISQKITATPERNRLKKIVQSVKPRNYGVIIRTVAEGKQPEELEAEVQMLVARWEAALQKLRKAKQRPALIVEEIGRAEAILRDHFNPNFESIHINDKAVYEEIRSYIAQIEPKKEKIVQYYDDELPLFDVYNVTKQLKSSFGRIVTLKKGAYLVVDHTEALHVVDVNSGTRAKGSMVQEDNAFEVNKMAVDEVARQMRLRDMGGIVVIDLIDMHDAGHKQEIYDRMRANLQYDPAKHQVLPLSKFCLMQITRQRVRPVMTVDTQEHCPTCDGTGSIRPSVLFDEMLQSKLEMILHIDAQRVTLYVHPYIYAYLKRGFPSRIFRWRLRYGRGLHVCPDESLAFLQYRFVDGDGAEMDVWEPKEMQ